MLKQTIRPRRARANHAARADSQWTFTASPPNDPTPTSRRQSRRTYRVGCVVLDELYDVLFRQIITFELLIAPLPCWFSCHFGGELVNFDLCDENKRIATALCFLRARIKPFVFLIDWQARLWTSISVVRNVTLFLFRYRHKIRQNQERMNR